MRSRVECRTAERSGGARRMLTAACGRASCGRAACRTKGCAVRVEGVRTDGERSRARSARGRAAARPHSVHLSACVARRCSIVFVVLVVLPGGRGCSAWRAGECRPRRTLEAASPPQSMSSRPVPARVFVGRQLDLEAGRLGRGHDVDAHGLHGRPCLEGMLARLTVHPGTHVAKHAVAAGEGGREAVAHLEGFGLERGHDAGELVLAVA